MADVDIGRALSGLGAAFKNEMPAFIQQTRQEDLDAEKRAEREMFLSDRSFDRGIAAEDRAMRLSDRDRSMAASEATRLATIDEKRQRTLFIDSKIALDALNAGNLNEVYERFTDRVNFLPSMGVTNLKLSEDVQRLAAGAFQNPDDLLNLRNRLEGYVNTGIAYEVLDKPEVDSFTLSEDEIRFETIDGVSMPVAYGPESVPKPDAFTQSEWMAAQFGSRTKTSGDIIESLGPNFTGFVSRGVGAVPAGFRTEERQSFDQATRNFINATLRRESGAAIAPSEFESANLQYIPQVGDTEAQLRQKTQNRKTISAALRLEAGEAYNQLTQMLAEESGTPAETLIEQSVNIWTPIPAGNSKEGEKAVDANGLEIIVQDGMWVEKI
jgi:hypothetical protein